MTSLYFSISLSISSTKGASKQPRSLMHSPSSSQQNIPSPLQPLHLLQTNRRRDPDKADQRTDLLPHAGLITRYIQTSDRPLQSLRSCPAAVTVRVVIAARDAQDRVFDIAIVFLLHGFGGLALALALGAVLAEDGAGEDFDFGDGVGGVGGVLEHGVDEVIFVAGKFISLVFVPVSAVGSGTYLSFTSRAQLL